MLLQWEQLTDMADVVKEAVQAVEESGIVFIDEIDKVSGTSHCYTYCYTYDSTDSRACRSVVVSRYFRVSQ
jgi:AAA domain (Cdc48 subfamily)